MDFLLEEEKNSLLEKVEKELFNDRIIYLNEEICSFTISNIVTLIDKINKDDEGKSEEERSPIHLYITSYGGSAYDGWEIVDAIENSKTPVYTYVRGYAMSMALPIFLSGKKRFIGKRATLLYHELRGGAHGTRQEVKRLDKEYDRLQKLYDDYIISKTTLNQDILNELQEKITDWYIGLDEAKKYNMYDEII
jgi:ATP-dependent Clp protease, protease subunit